MKQHIRRILSIMVLMIIFCSLPFLLQAQCADPADPACNVPIDGGLSLLLAAGVGYGVKKIKDSRKKQKSEENL